VNALFSLMCFHASRVEARKNERGELILYEDQDETLWNPELISRGAYYLHQASQGQVISKYHLEAGIAYWHTMKMDTKEKWSAILQLYDQLIQIERSPMAALNRAFALSKVLGKEAAIREVDSLDLADNHYYYTLLGELYRDHDNQKSKANFQKALSLAKTMADKQIIQKKIDLF
jgi:predicted RNA polymerase sigma factor